MALFNLGAAPAPVTASWQDVGFCGAASVRDLWSHRDLGTQRDGFSATLAAHASRLLRVRPRGESEGCPSPAAAPTPTFYEAESSQNTLSGGASVVACGSCSGGSEVGNLFRGGAVQFNGVSAPADGTYALTLYYATGDERTAYLSVNGAADTTLGFFPRTGGFTTPTTYTVQVRLNAGPNTLRFSTRPTPPGFGTWTA